MLIANDPDGIRVSADNVLFNGSFTCPECNGEVLFVNGLKKIKHFRHLVKSNCGWEPETERHIEMKQFCKKFFKLEDDNLEVGLGFARPDLYDEVKRIAIEVQHSNLTLEKFLERTENYTKNNIAVLWIFDCKLVKENINAMLKKAHELYFGRIYIYWDGYIKPIHFSPKGRYVTTYDTDSDTPYNERYGSYYKIYKNKKTLSAGSIIVNPNLNIQRNTWKDNNYLIAKFNDVPFWKKEVKYGAVD